MATSGVSDQGFFSSSGVLRTESAAPTASSASASSASNIESSVADQTADATASAITDAVVVRISSQLNVSGSGFDSGVRDNVQEAVSAALSKLSQQQTAAPARREIGGTYQNEIIAQSRQAAQPQPPASASPAVEPDVTPLPQPTPQEKDKKKIDDRGRDDKVRELAERLVDQRSKQLNRSQSDEERAKEVEKVREFYSRGDRQDRLRALVEGGEE